MPAARREINGWSLRWDEARAQAARDGGWWPGETIADLALREAETDPGRVLVIDDKRQLTTAELVTEAQILARGFVARGLKPGNVISIMLPNWHEATIIYLAASFAGLVVHLIVPNYRQAEVSFMLQDCGSRMIFVPENFRKFDYVDMMHSVNTELADPVEVVVLRGKTHQATDFATMLLEHHAVAFPVVDPDSVKMVMYTSGTSGRAKGVLQSHNSIAAAINQICKYWHVAAGDSFFVPSPISHIGGSIYAFELPFMGRTTVVLQEAWEPEAALALIEQHGCTHMAGATPFLQGLLIAMRKTGSRLPRFKVFICGGASVPASLIREATEQFENCIVSRVFGCTEIPMITAGSMNKGDVRHAAETDGCPGLCDVALLDANGARTTTEGEVIAAGPQMLLGYLRQEDEAGRFNADGFFLTGDLAQLVDEKYLVISGRLKDIIIRNGENISPKEVEDILILHPAIAEVAIVGVPDQRTGEQAVAIIVPKPDQSVTLKDVAEILNAHQVAKFKIPERVELREALPRNAAGKVLKNVLRDSLLERAK